VDCIIDTNAGSLSGDASIPIDCDFFYLSWPLATFAFYVPRFGAGDYGDRRQIADLKAKAAPTNGDEKLNPMLSDSIVL
jgi:hypothetical protein